MPNAAPARAPVRSMDRAKFFLGAAGAMCNSRGRRTTGNSRDRAFEMFGVDICADPDLAMKPKVAALIMFEGMINGEFTGKKLTDYLNAKAIDWIGAWRIINGTGRAAEIAGIAKQFYADLWEAA